MGCSARWSPDHRPSQRRAGCADDCRSTRRGAANSRCPARSGSTGRFQPTRDGASDRDASQTTEWGAQRASVVTAGRSPSGRQPARRAGVSLSRDE